MTNDSERTDYQTMMAVIRGRATPEQVAAFMATHASTGGAGEPYTRAVRKRNAARRQQARDVAQAIVKQGGYPARVGEVVYEELTPWLRGGLQQDMSGHVLYIYNNEYFDCGYGVLWQMGWYLTPSSSEDELREGALVLTRQRHVAAYSTTDGRRLWMQDDGGDDLPPIETQGRSSDEILEDATSRADDAGWRDDDLEAFSVARRAEQDDGGE